MEAQEVRNEQGELVLPESEYNPVDPQNAVYVKNEEYESLKSGGGEEAGVQEPGTEAAPENTGGDNGGSLADTAAPQIDYDAILKEKTGGKYEKWEDILAKVDSTQEQIELNDTSRKIIEALQLGKEDELADILYKRKMLAGVDKMDGADAIKMKLQLENPDWTPDDVDDEYATRYDLGVDPEDMDDAEYAKLKRRADRKVLADAKVAKEYLSKFRETIQLPSYGKEESSDQDREAFEQEINKFAEEYQSGIKNSLQSFNKLDLSINDKDVQFSHEYSVEDSEKTDLAAKASNYWNYVEGRYAKDGKYDTQKLLQDIYFLENREKIMKSVATRAMNLARVELVKGVANVQNTKTPAPGNFAEDQAQADFERFMLA